MKYKELAEKILAMPEERQLDDVAISIAKMPIERQLDDVVISLEEIIPGNDLVRIGKHDWALGGHFVISVSF